MQGLRWRDIDWNDGLILVHSPKTEHHEGRETRLIPLFDELYQPLRDAWDMADEGEEYVLPYTRVVSGAALRKPVVAAIEAAGATAWPKLFVALRATRDTELREQEPGYVVDDWIGHDEAVAKKNYSQITDKHFGKYNKKAKQNPKQQVAATTCNELQQDPTIPSNTPGLLPVATLCSLVHTLSSGRYRTRTCGPLLVRK